MCNRCNLLYVGHTVNPFKIRLTSHFSCIKHKDNNTTLYRHFTLNESCLLTISCFIIDYNVNWDKSKLLTKEGYYQKYFKTITPYGLNDVENAYYRRNGRPIKLPYGTNGLENLEYFKKHDYVFTGHKNLTRILHQNKFN